MFPVEINMIKLSLNFICLIQISCKILICIKIKTHVFLECL